MRYVRETRRLIGWGALWSLKSATLWAASSHYPVVIQNCGRNEVISHRPRCAIFHDVDMAEMGFVLHLQPFMCGVTGISGWNKATPSFRKQQEHIPELAPRYPTLEQLVAHRADLFVAGWNYGMTVGGSVTPESLARFRIPVAILSESCPRAPGRERLPITLEALLYNDIRRLGKIFDREEAARKLISSYKARVNAVRARLRGRRPVSVFVYDSGRSTPTTAGRDALLTRLIWLSGGQNIMDDLPTNWGATSWETVAMRNADAIILVDYGSGTRASRDILLSRRVLRESSAVEARRFISITYDALTPGPANITAIETLAAFLHPEAFR